jgi:hypothetical protein
MTTKQNNITFIPISPIVYVQPKMSKSYTPLLPFEIIRPVPPLNLYINDYDDKYEYVNNSSLAPPVDSE